MIGNAKQDEFQEKKKSMEKMFFQENYTLASRTDFEHKNHEPSNVKRKSLFFR